MALRKISKKCFSSDHNNTTTTTTTYNQFVLIKQPKVKMEFQNLKLHLILLLNCILF